MWKFMVVEQFLSVDFISNFFPSGNLKHSSAAEAVEAVQWQPRHPERHPTDPVSRLVGSAKRRLETAPSRVLDLRLGLETLEATEQWARPSSVI